MASHILRRKLSTRITPLATSSRRLLSSASVLRQAQPLQSLSTQPPKSDPRSTESNAESDSGGVRPAEVKQSALGAVGVFDTHTVEDLHGLSAADILAESGSARHDSQMRHFTGT